jgi:polyisoprenoid-binding protein YceI
MATWTIDHSHSEVNFKVRHMLVSNVRGNFGSYSATIEAADENFSDAVIRFEAAIDSINTGNEQRDGHLKSADFFDAASHLTMTFASRTVSVVSAHEMKVEGDLTIRGVTKPITLDVIYNGTVSGFGGVAIAGFEITGTVNRFDYGLAWNALTEAGGVVVGSDVKIEIVAEFNRA